MLVALVPCLWQWPKDHQVGYEFQAAPNLRLASGHHHHLHLHPWMLSVLKLQCLFTFCSLRFPLCLSEIEISNCLLFHVWTSNLKLSFPKDSCFVTIQHSSEPKGAKDPRCQSQFVYLSNSKIRFCTSISVMTLVWINSFRHCLFSLGISFHVKSLFWAYLALFLGMCIILLNHVKSLFWGYSGLFSEN